MTSQNNFASNGVIHVINSVLTLPDHLYFRTINTNDECGQIDAAPRIPPALFAPSNAGKLAQYAALTVALYSVESFPSIAKLQLGQCSGIGYNRTIGVKSANWAPDVLMGPICKARCNCVYPECPDQPDDPAAGKWCSLCGPRYNPSATIVDLYARSGASAAAALE